MLSGNKKLFKLFVVMLVFVIVLMTGCELSEAVDDSDEGVAGESFIISGQILDFDEEPLESYDSIIIKATGADDDYIVRGRDGDIEADGSWQIYVNEMVSVEIFSDDYQFVSGEFDNIKSDKNDIIFYGISAEIEIPDYYDLDFNNYQLIRVDAKAEEGFNYGFYLSIPDTAIENQGSHMFVESNNTGVSHYDIDFHDKAAKGRAEHYWLSERTDKPALIPVFPRSGGEDFYTHALGKGNFTVSESRPYARLDNQLVAMIDYAQKLLKMNGLNLEKQVLIHGYSASGLFATRFVKVHPERVRAVVSGGIAGMPLLPGEKYNGKDLNYPIGVADFEELTGEKFDIEAYREVSKYYYMGYFDKNDGVGEVADEVFGEEIIYDRWEGAQKVYDMLDVPVQFVTYNNTYHEVKREMVGDIVKFFEKNTGDEFVEIDYHQYEYVEYKELENLLIKDVIWVGDPDMPERFAERLYEDDSHFIIIVDDIFEDISVFSQIYDFMGRAGFDFTLAGEGETIDIDKTDFNTTISANGEDLIAGIRVLLSDEKLDRINYGVEYDFIVHNNDDEDYKWIVEDEISLRRF